MEMTPLFERTRIHIHLDPNRPPITKAECLSISSAMGAIRRATNTIKMQSAVLAKYEDRSDKPSDSGVLINASLKCLVSAAYWLDEGIPMLDRALVYAKEGK